MAYAASDLEPGMVILCMPAAHNPLWGRLLDEAIQWSSGPFVHAAYVGNGYLIEQIAPVRKSPLNKYADNGWVYRIEGMTPAKAGSMIEWGLERWGQHYGYRALLEDAAMYDLHDWKMLHAHPQYVVCSGFVERAARCGAGISLTEQPLPSPTSLAFSPRLLGPRPWDQHERRQGQHSSC